MCFASQVHAYRPVCVLLGGSFAPQRSLDPKPLICALLRSRERLVDVAVEMHATTSAPAVAHQAVGHHG